jgi:hypothetical protein
MSYIGARLRPAEVVFGRVANYPFPELPPSHGEMCKLRPVIVVGADPMKHFLAGGYLRAIPLSTQPVYRDVEDNGWVQVKIGGKAVHAVTAKIATINPTNLVTCAGITPPDQMEKIRDSFLRYLLPSRPVDGQSTIIPGGIYTLHWPNKTRSRTYLVIGNLESRLSDLPVYAIPVTMLGSLIRPEMKLRHLSQDRFQFAHKIGQVSPELLAGLRHRLITDLGFSLPARPATVSIPTGAAP